MGWTWCFQCWFRDVQLQCCRCSILGSKPFLFPFLNLSISCVRTLIDSRGLTIHNFCFGSLVKIFTVWEIWSSKDSPKSYFSEVNSDAMNRYSPALRFALLLILFLVVSHANNPINKNNSWWIIWLQNWFTNNGKFCVVWDIKGSKARPIY